VSFLVQDIGELLDVRRHLSVANAAASICRAPSRTNSSNSDPVVVGGDFSDPS
jgi:hypothetical protein